MSARIVFKQDKEKNLAVFRYYNLPRFLMALLVSLPIIACFIYFLIVIFIAGVDDIGDLLSVLAILLIYFLLMIGSNMFQVPVLNPQWIFTSIRKLTIKNMGTVSFRYGFFPISFSRQLLIEDIEKLQMVKQYHGRGLGFFLYYLSDNETRNGFLAEEGKKLAEHLNTLFKDGTSPESE